MRPAIFTAYFCVWIVAAAIVTATFVRLVAASGGGAVLIIFAAVAVGALMWDGWVVNLRLEFCE